MRSAFTRWALPMTALLASACTNLQRDPPVDPNAPQSPYTKQQPVDTGPGCYDHRGRIERTITTAAECASVSWVWRS